MLNRPSSRIDLHTLYFFTTHLLALFSQYHKRDFPLTQRQVTFFVTPHTPSIRPLATSLSYQRSNQAINISGTTMKYNEMIILIMILIVAFCIIFGIWFFKCFRRVAEAEMLARGRQRAGQEAEAHFLADDSSHSNKSSKKPSKKHKSRRGSSAAVA